MNYVELSFFLAELNSEHAQRVAEMELAMQQKLRERQKVYEKAFNQDVEKYLSTGCLEGRGDLRFFKHYIINISTPMFDRGDGVLRAYSALFVRF